LRATHVVVVAAAAAGQVGELILHLGLDKQLTQQQQPPPQQQQQQQQEVEAGRKPHQQQQQQQAAVAHDLLQQLENLVARLLPTAAEDALSKQQNPLLPLSSITYSWARVGYKPYHGTVVRLTEQFVAVLEQLVEAGMVAALQQQQQRNGPGSGARQPGQQGSIPSSPDSSMDEDALLGSPPLPTTPTTSSSSSSSESMPGAAAPAAAATRFPSRQALCRVLCNFVWALCKLHPGSPAWVPLAAAFTQLSPLLGPRDIASIAYAWAAAGRRDVVLFARLASLAEAQVEGFKEQALPNLLWAYATVQCHHQVRPQPMCHNSMLWHLTWSGNVTWHSAPWLAVGSRAPLIADGVRCHFPAQAAQRLLKCLLDVWGLCS
jgi:hypothetical protein